MKVLVADDDATSRLIARTALIGLGHECHAACDGLEAWDEFRTWRPDVVISDWMMPGMSGLALCRKIREYVHGDYTYFIVVTSHGEVADVIEGMNAGADDYLVKPLDADDLEARLIAAARVTALHHELALSRSEMQDLNDELAAIARRDPLTTLGNRRAMQEDLELLEARASRYGHRFCMALVDVDLFKAFNDTYGHQAGDDVLQQVAAKLREEVRGGDTLYRYGGEEFLCIFPEQSIDSGDVAVERMRVAVEGLDIRHSASPTGVLTISAGLAVLDPDRSTSTSDVLKAADEALYRAKELGRNRIENATALPA